jgi:hypothetical protein
MNSVNRLVPSIIFLTLLSGCQLDGHVEVATLKGGQTQFTMTSGSKDKVCVENISVSEKDKPVIWMARQIYETRQNDPSVCENIFVYGESKKNFETSPAAPLIKGKDYIVSFDDNGIRSSTHFIAGQ